MTMQMLLIRSNNKYYIIICPIYLSYLDEKLFIEDFTVGYHLKGEES